VQVQRLAVQLLDELAGEAEEGVARLALALALVPPDAPLPVSARIEATPCGVNAAIPIPGLADLIGRCAQGRPTSSILLAADDTVALHLRPVHPVLGEPHLARRACGRTTGQPHSQESLS